MVAVRADENRRSAISKGGKISGLRSLCECRRRGRGASTRSSSRLVAWWSSVRRRDDYGAMYVSQSVCVGLVWSGCGREQACLLSHGASPTVLARTVAAEELQIAREQRQVNGSTRGPMRAGKMGTSEAVQMQREKQGEAGARVQATASAALSSWAGIQEWKGIPGSPPIGCRLSPAADGGAQASGPLL
jgi:hypothetical protein